jgi:ABC-type uncharacterized transport system ATPase subunit
VLSGTIPAVREQWGGGRKVLLHVEQATDAALEQLRVHPTVTAVQRLADGTVSITLAVNATMGSLLARCAELFTIVDVRTEQPSLHEVYINTVGAASASSGTTTATGEAA